MARVLVTGAAGFIGSHLAEACAARGDSVVALDCLTDSYDPALKLANLASLAACDAVDVLHADLMQTDLVGLLGDIEVVYHQAAQPGVRTSWSDGFGAYLERNVHATQRLLEAVQATGGRARVVFASSSSVYGNAAPFPTRETDPLAPFSPYGVTKLAAEHLCRVYAENHGVHSVVLRYFTVFGPRQRPDMSMHRLCVSALGGQVFGRYGDGTQVREFTYVDDIIAGNLAAAGADIPSGTAINLAGGSAIDLNGLVALVERLTGARVPIEAHPASPGDARRNGASIERAHTLLGWEPTVGLESGLAAQLDWHRSQAGSLVP